MAVWSQTGVLCAHGRQHTSSVETYWVSRRRTMGGNVSTPKPPERLCGSEDVNRAYISIMVRSEWVNFQSWVNYPFKKKNDKMEILVNGRWETAELWWSDSVFQINTSLFLAFAAGESFLSPPSDANVHLFYGMEGLLETYSFGVRMSRGLM